MRKNNGRIREYRHRAPVLSITREALSFDEFDKYDDLYWKRTWEE